MTEIHVFGHQRPDSDSICSTIAYTTLKRALGVENINAYRLDNINKETQFILDYFRVEEPKLLPDLEPKVSDLNLYIPNVINKNDPIKKVWDILLSTSGSRVIPCVDDEGMLEGIISVGDLTKILMEIFEINVTADYEILFSNLLEILESEVAFGEYAFEKITGRIIISSSVINHNLINEDIVVTTRILSAKEYLLSTDCGCVILTEEGDLSILEGIRDNCAIIQVNKDIFNIVTSIKQSISARSVMRRDGLITINVNSYLEDAKLIIMNSTHRNFPVVSDKGELLGIISRRHLIDYPRKRAILIDHNERKQSVDGIGHAEILEIIDHHRVADVQTDAPLLVRSEPLGCTATIIYKMYKENNIEITGKMAGIMLGAILSDTLKFNSPTCTDFDREVAYRLASICDVNVDEFALTMFKEGTSIKDVSFDELLIQDTKIFEIGGYDIYISQINTLDLEEIDDRQEEYIEAMEEFCHRTRCSLLVLMVTDIINAGSKIIVHGRQSGMAEKAFGIEKEARSTYLEGVVSRKKQVVPRLIQASR